MTFFILSQRHLFVMQIVRWQGDNIANLPGVIALFIGLLMWVTSLKPVRKCYFELFYHTHHLYAIFITFLALHVGDSVFSCAAGGIFLFVLDRFLRFWQSRRNVSVVSATCLPCGSVELVLSKPRGTPYAMRTWMEYMQLWLPIVCCLNRLTFVKPLKTRRLTCNIVSHPKCFLSSGCLVEISSGG